MYNFDVGKGLCTKTVGLKSVIGKKTDKECLNSVNLALLKSIVSRRYCTLLTIFRRKSE